MISSIAILIFSTALLFFYLQTLCEKVLRREFSRAYCQDVLEVIDLEFPRLRQALSANAPMSYSQIRLALKCDFYTLRYLVKNGDPKRRRFSWQERMLVGYFRVLLLVLPLRYAFNLGERQSVMKLTVILYHFANLVGERLTIAQASNMVPSRQS
jgi:hypothetical protein